MLRLLRPLIVLLGLGLLMANAASALAAASAEKPASGSATVTEHLIDNNTRLSEEAVRENPAPRYDLASDSPVAARGITGTGRTVIGKLGDLKSLAQGEQTLLDRLPDLGSPQTNQYQNSSVLRQELSLGNPIRDASVDGAGNLINNTGFLQAERNLLLNQGWTYDAGTTLWSPPIVP
jgi:hypothetical protein